MTLLAGAVILFSGCNNDDDPVTYSVSITDGGNGTAEADKATAEAGTTVRLTATAADGFMFEKWTVESGDVTLSPDANTNPATFTMPAGNVSIKAEFEEMPDSYTVYIVGECRIADGPATACYWTGGKMTVLDNPHPEYNDYAYDITVSGGNVYVAGNYFTDEVGVGCYWKDNVRNDLALVAGVEYNNPRAITLVNGAVYVAGAYQKPDGSQTACYWKDGTVADLPLPADAGASSNAFSATTGGGKVYVSGNYRNAQNRNQTCYWIDNELHDLPLPEGRVGSVWAGSITVSDGKVYAAGSYIPGDRQQWCYWADGQRIDLTPPADGSRFISDLAVSEGKVYLAMDEYDSDFKPKVCCWVDGQVTYLNVPAGSTHSYTLHVCIVDGKPCIAGCYVKDGKMYSCYWVDGERGGDAEMLLPQGGVFENIYDAAIVKD